MCVFTEAFFPCERDRLLLLFPSQWLSVRLGNEAPSADVKSFVLSAADKTSIDKEPAIPKQQ